MSTPNETQEHCSSPKALALADAALGPHLDMLKIVGRSFNDSTDDDVMQAVHEVCRRRSPERYADDQRLSHALDDSYNGITMALMEAALIVGIQVGRTLLNPDTASAGASNDDEGEDQSLSAGLDTDAYGATIGTRLDRVTRNLALIHASAAMLRKEPGGTELHDEEIIEAIERVSGACMSDLWWIECADTELLDKPAPTADERESLSGGAR